MPSPLKLVLTADFHMGSPFAFFDEARALDMQERQIGLLREICQTARDSGAHILGIAGDLFDISKPDKALLRQVQQSFALCPDTAVVICPGNHDPYYPDSIWDDPGWPDHVFIARESPSVFSFSKLDAQVYAAPFMARSASTSLFNLRGISDTFDPSFSYHLLFLHGEVLPAGQTSHYNPISRESLIQSGFDLALVGHIHKRFECVPDFGKTPYLVPGCPMGRGFDECGECGFYTAQITPPDRQRKLSSLVHFNFHPSAVGSFQKLSVDLNDCHAENQEELVIYLQKVLISGVLNSEKGQWDAIQLFLRGNFLFRPDTDYLERQLSQLCFYLKIRDESFRYRPFSSYLNEKSIRGYIAAVLDERREEAASEEELTRLEAGEHLLAEVMEGDIT